jgi:hypothetical protein
VITPRNHQKKQDTTSCTSTKEELIASFTNFFCLNKKRRMANIKKEIVVCGGTVATRFGTI